MRTIAIIAWALAMLTFMAGEILKSRIRKKHDVANAKEASLRYIEEERRLEAEAMERLDTESAAYHAGRGSVLMELHESTFMETPGDGEDNNPQDGEQNQ